MNNIASYWFWESELTPDFCQETIDLNFLGRTQEPGMSRSREGEMTIDESRRKTIIHWVKPGATIFDAMYHYITVANKSAKWNYDLSGMEDVQIGQYEDGGHYTWHADIDPPCDQNFQRKLSCSVQLSDENSYEGGDLILQNANGDTYTVPRKQGSIVVFPSTLRHKVTPVTSGTRFSAVAWMRGPAFK